ncbi:DUF4142 domain-containing protein [Caldimonas sp. KR1-144]|uniref:DUF4142 domain-containing protein n=1 Tax=Caldimonas sp. KR1-144 TaxID=3400911 RepID=UPI003C0A3DDD
MKPLQSIAAMASLAVAALCVAVPVLGQDLPYPEADFLRKAAAGGHAEVQASQLAQSRATTREVKDFATQMLAEHAKNAEALERLAASKAVTLPQVPTKAQTAEIEALAATEGAEFDRRYAERFGVKAHEEMLALMNTGAQAKDPHVKDYAEQTRAAVEQHLKMGKALQSSVAKRTSAAAARP